MAADAGFDLSGVSGTGPNGRVIRADVEEAMATAKSAAPAQHAPTPVMDSAPGIGCTDIENSTIRKVIADRLTY
jgi:pyruvate dehydrogenase E2 component (dihydrolipoamide acetyltransferase)